MTNDLQTKLVFKKEEKIMSDDNMLEFFMDLYPESSSGYLTISTFKPNNVTHYFKTDEFDETVLKITDLNKTSCIYFGVGLRKNKLDKYHRGKTEDVIALPFLWLDVDVLHDAHKSTNYPPDFETAKYLVDKFPIKPTMWIHSGHGFYPIWKFKKIWQFENANDRDEAEDLLTNFHSVMYNFFNEAGYKLDNTSDLARVLRIPYTVNRKHNPVKASVIEHYPALIYDVETIKEVLSEYDVNKSKLIQETNNSLSFTELDNIEKINYKYSIVKVSQDCIFIRYCIEYSATLPEPEWFTLGQLCAKAEDGTEMFHKWSENYSKYSYEEAEKKLKYCREETKPATCNRIYKEIGFEGCKDCYYFNKINSPVKLGTLSEYDLESPFEIESTTSLKNNIPADLIKSIGDLQNIKSYEWIVKDVFPRGYIGFIFSEAGIGKTWLNFYLSAKLTSGESILNYNCIKPANVLLFEGDAGNTLIKTRIKKFAPWINEHNFMLINRYDSDNVDFSLSLSTNRGKENIEKIFDAYTPDFVIIDTLISFIDSENKLEDTKPAVDFLRKLAEKYNCFILICHHSRKRPSDGNKIRKLDQSDLIGSSVFSRLSGFILAIDKIYDADKEQIKNAGRVHTEKCWWNSDVKFDFYIEDIETATGIKTDFRIEEYNSLDVSLTNRIISFMIKKPDKACTRKQLVNNFTESESSIKRALQELQENKIIFAEGSTNNKKFFLHTVNEPNNTEIVAGEENGLAHGDEHESNLDGIDLDNINLEL